MLIQYVTCFPTIQDIILAILKDTTLFRTVTNSGLTRKYVCGDPHCLWQITCQKKQLTKEKYKTKVIHVPVNFWYVSSVSPHVCNCVHQVKHSNGSGPPMAEPKKGNLVPKKRKFEVDTTTMKELNNTQWEKEINYLKSVATIHYQNWQNCCNHIISLEDKVVRLEKLVECFQKNQTNVLQNANLDIKSTNLQETCGKKATLKNHNPSSGNEKSPDIVESQVIDLVKHDTDDSVFPIDSVLKKSEHESKFMKPQTEINSDGCIKDYAVATRTHNCNQEFLAELLYNIKETRALKHNYDVFMKNHRRKLNKTDPVSETRNKITFLSDDNLFKLLPNTLLDDNVVDAFSTLISETFHLKTTGKLIILPFMLIYNCHEHDYSRVEKWSKKSKLMKPLEKYKTVIVPICNGNHWTTIVVQNSVKQFDIYDSMNRSKRTKEIEMVTSYLKHEYTSFDIKEWSTCMVPCPNQGNNTDDCGVHVMMHILCLTLKVPLHFEQKDCNLLRVYFFNCLRQRKLIFYD